MDNSFFIQEDRRNIITGDAIYAYPVTGLITSDSDFKLGHVSLLKFNRHEWWTAEKSAILDDWEYECMNNRPLWAYFSVPSIIKNETTCIFLIDTLIESLRIFKKGFILEPKYTVSSRYYNNTSSRIPGIYRTKYLEAIWGEEAKQNCLQIFANEYSEIEELFSTLCWVKINHFYSISGILECFNVISVPSLSDEFIAQNLFICFEMLFGNKQEFKKYNTYPNERALNLLQSYNCDSIDLKNYLLTDLNGYRNKILHGIKVETSEINYNLKMLELTIRIGIKQYIILLSKIHKESPNLEELKSISPNLNPNIIFNKQLSKL